MNYEENNYGESNYEPNYNVDPQDNSYRYTGTEEPTAASTQQTDTYTDANASQTTGGYTGTSSYQTTGTYTDTNSYQTTGSYTDTNSYQSTGSYTDRYYSPYERRGAAPEGSPTNPQPMEKKKHGFGVTVAKCACLAAVFGLVAGGVFGGVNYLIPQKEVPVAMEQTKPETPALTTSPDTIDDMVQTTPVSSGTTVTDVSRIVEKAMPSIVAITNMSEVEYRTWFGQNYSQEQQSAGSGIIVSEDDEYLYIATNNHVVEGAKTLTVQFSDDSTVAAEVRGTSPANDLAVVKVIKKDIDADTLKTIKIATVNNKGQEKVGQAVIAIGNALGYGQSVTSGIISALEREVSSTDNSTGESITNVLTQTDASINPGNSGGALLNVRGEVIGINSAKYGGSYVDGMGFAIPMTTAAPIIDQLITREEVKPEKAAYLGINGVDVDDNVAAKYNMPAGIYIAKVYEGSAADKAGIQQGDIITAFDGETVSSMEEIQELMKYHEAGSNITITIRRADNGQYVEQELEVTLGSKN